MKSAKGPGKRAERVLVIGSWAKEQRTIENILNRENTRVFAYMSTPNPGIVRLADCYRTGALEEIADMVDFAVSKNVSLVVITTAEPLSRGIVNALNEVDIEAFGPTREAARLESDKSFARELMAKYGIDGLPEFDVFDNVDKALEYAERRGWNVAVKPIGLTEGLGVKVMGDQLRDGEDVIAYIREIFNRKIGGEAKVLIEERLVGEEFTIQSLVYDDKLTPLPAVQDFKKKLIGGRGLNTAGMGSYSAPGRLLPFMEEGHYRKALEIMKRTVAAYRFETGGVCRGFLYGQFMITESGLKLIEYNFRPGDPEWLNILAVLNNNLIDVIRTVLRGEIPDLRLEGSATVCKYLVPAEYPERSHRDLDISVSESRIEEAGARLYYSCGIDENGVLNVGSERGVTIVAKGQTVPEANERVERAISTVRGDFHYRPDIATEALIERKKERVRNMNGKGDEVGKTGGETGEKTGSEMRGETGGKTGTISGRSDDALVIKKAEEERFLEIWDLVSRCGYLEKYGKHLYRIILRYLGDVLIAERRGEIIGVAMGFSSRTDPDTWFFWQVGVCPEERGAGIATALVGELEGWLRERGKERIVLTVDPNNTPSRKLFEKLGYDNVSSKEGEAVRVNGTEAMKDHYGPGRHFILFEKSFRR